MQNYNQASTGFNFSLSYPLRRHSFQRIGATYNWSRANITAFSTASQTFFQTISFRRRHPGSQRTQRHHYQPAFVLLQPEHS